MPEGSVHFDRLVPTPSLDCSNKNDLVKQLQNAFKLEWATIPVYLNAAYTIKDTGNGIRRIIRAIAIEEMYHMTYVGNMLIALGHPPTVSFDTAPKFHDTLPGGVLPKLVVDLKRFSKEQVHDTFMAIEIPKLLETYLTFTQLEHCMKTFQSALEFLGTLFSMLQQRTSRLVIMARLNRLLTQSLHKSF